MKTEYPSREYRKTINPVMNEHCTVSFHEWPHAVIPIRLSKMVIECKNKSETMHFYGVKIFKFRLMIRFW